MAPSDRSVSADQAAPRGRSFFADVCNQTLILTKKNFLVQGRSTTALLTQLFIGVIFLAILRLMQFSIETNPGEKAAEKALCHFAQRPKPFPLAAGKRQTCSWSPTLLFPGPLSFSRSYSHLTQRESRPRYEAEGSYESVPN
jgi:hypothetical protein